MELRLKEVLNHEEENYILPFLWQHGEEEEKIREMMNIVYMSGIKAVCIESRPHPDFVGAGWWRDMDIIMEEARKKNMRVWVLDDAHFPSGYCNGCVEEGSPYAKRYLDHYTIDAMGPQTETSFFIFLEEGEELLGVVAAKRINGAAGILHEPVDITDRVRGNVVYWDIPQGYWNIIILKTTLLGSGRKKYINPIDHASVRFFLDTVYEPHLKHYQKDFGKTFAGFFSDEPELGNCIGEYGHNAGIGQPDMSLPWSSELCYQTKGVWGKKFAMKLAALWNQIDGITPEARYEYMNMVTDLYGKNFSGQIGAWCQTYGVEYIGHVIEDNGIHARLGLGTGHFFKALWGQHMSGIDVVLQQIRPGYDKMEFYHIGGKGTYQGMFFHYGLAKLGTSLGHLDAKKKGRTMCEVYGAYGWSEGLKLMKWLTDHMLVRGVNWFVPHAFTAGDFPDADCPPHFYGCGNNPQFPWFSYLCSYMNRMSHLLNGGKHVAEVAILYTAEMEWMGAYQPFEEIGMLLAGNQIDYDVIPMGILKSCEIHNRRMKVGEEEFSALIIPNCQRIPEELGRWMMYAAEGGFPILFSGILPEVIATGWNQNTNFYGWNKDSKVSNTAKDKKQYDEDMLRACKSVFEERISDLLLKTLDAFTVRDIRCNTAEPMLRYYHYRHQKGDFYMFFNEDTHDRIDTALSFPGCRERQLCWYDAFDNLLKPVYKKDDATIKLELAPGQACVLYMGEEEVIPCMNKSRKGKRVVLDEGWTIACRRYDETEFSDAWRIEKFYNITASEETEDFSGTIRYDIDFEWNPGLEGEQLEIDFGEVYETLEVWLNDEKIAVRIGAPYSCMAERVQQGTNRLSAYVTNTLVHRYRDKFSATMPVEGSGILGPVVVQGFICSS